MFIESLFTLGTTTNSKLLEELFMEDEQEQTEDTQTKEQILERAIRNNLKDREHISNLLAKAVKDVVVGNEEHKYMGTIISKYHDNLFRNNEQLLRIYENLNKMNKSGQGEAGAEVVDDRSIYEILEEENIDKKTK